MASQFGTSPTSPATRASAVTPADAPLPAPARALYVGVGGNVTVIPIQGGTTAVTFVGVPSGSVLPVAVKQVNASGTTASSIVAMH